MRCGHRGRNFCNQRTYEMSRRGCSCEREEIKCEERCVLECENRHMKLRLSNDCKSKSFFIDIKKPPRT